MTTFSPIRPPSSPPNSLQIKNSDAFNNRWHEVTVFLDTYSDPEKRIDYLKRCFGNYKVADKRYDKFNSIRPREYDGNFSENSHSFRPHRSRHTTLLQIERTFTGAKWFVEGDIETCFDSFDLHVLIEILRRRIEDEAFIVLMWEFLKAGYMEQ